MADLGMAVVLTGEQAVKAGLAGVREETRKLMDATVGVSGSFKSAAESASAFTAGIRSLAEAENSLHVAAQNQITDLRAQKIALQDVGYRQAQKEIKALQEELNPAKVQTFSQTWQELASKYYLVSQAAHVAGGVIMSLVDAASKYELLHARLNAVEGSAALGNRDFADVQTLAKKPGLGFEEAASTFATLRGMKVTAAEAKALINGIAQANASAAGTAEQFGRVMYQIQQSVSLGRLMAEDLRPIQQAIPTLGAAMQEHFGSNQAEQLNKILEKSGKSVREFWLEVAELGSKLPATGETIANNLDNMGDAWTRFKASLVSSSAIRGVTGDLAALIDTLARASEKVNEGYNVQKRAADELGFQEGSGKTFHKPEGLGKRILRGLFPHEEPSAQETSVGGAMGAGEMLARMQVTQQYRDDLEGRLKIQKEAGEREISEQKTKDDRKQEAADKAVKKAGESEAKRLAAHHRASMANVEFTGPNEVTMRGESGPDAEHMRNVQGAERAREAREKKDLDARERTEKAALEDRKRAQKEYTKLIQDENQKRIEFERQYWRQVQTSATSTINSIAQTLIMSGGSMKDKLRQILAQGESALISGGVNMLMGAAFAPATGGASMAMPGALGLLGSFLGMRATGGAAIGPVGVGERGPEVFRPATPGTVYNSSSSHYNYSGPITVVVSGANANEVAKDLPRAIENAQRNRRQTSISR